MNKINGQVKLIDSIAYVPQQAWIQNATVRDNITFGKDYSQQRYSEIVMISLPCIRSAYFPAAHSVLPRLGSADTAWRGHDRNRREGHKLVRRSKAACQVCILI